MTALQTPEASADTPVRRIRLRRAVGWVLVAILVVGVALLAWRVSATAPGARGALDPEGRNDAGSLALAEILRDQGVEISVVRSRDTVRAALGEDTTLVMPNPFPLSDGAVLELVEAADRVVFLSSSTRLLRLLGLGADEPGSLGEVEAGCDVPEFSRVGSIRADRVFRPDAGVRSCFGDTERGALLLDERNGGRRVVIEGAKLFSNAYLAEDGNAALGLALLGQTDEVVWYVPSFADSDLEGESPDTLGSLTPAWVTPAILLLVVAGITAAVWRGRRFGPLVAETLPVTVRASETMQGRARLTAQAADAAHAASALRDGTVRRLARRLGLTSSAKAEEVADAAADRLRIPRGSLHRLLTGALPGDDGGLVEFARQLDDLESNVDQATRIVGDGDGSASERSEDHT